MSEGLGHISIHKNVGGSRARQFEALYKEHFDHLFHYAQALCRSGDMAKDIVSDVFFNLWRSDKDFQEIHNMAAYLFSAVKRQAIQTLGRSRKEYQDVEKMANTVAIDWIDPEEILLEKELRQRLDAITESLPPQCQLIFKMARNKGYKCLEISRELGISTETVKSQLAKAQSKLRASISAYYAEKDDSLSVNIRLLG